MPFQIFFGNEGPFDGEIGDNLLEIALRNHVDLDHACGGVCACSTCHIKVEAGADALTEASEDEEDQLDEARDVGLTSRLACQARITKAPADGKITATIPTWNTNLVQEGH